MKKIWENEAIREAHEELGVDARNFLDEKFSVFKIFQGNRHPTTIFFGFNMPHMTFFPQNKDEIRSYRWWSIKELDAKKKVSYRRNPKRNFILPNVNSCQKILKNVLATCAMTLLWKLRTTPVKTILLNNLTLPNFQTVNWIFWERLWKKGFFCIVS